MGGRKIARVAPLVFLAGLCAASTGCTIESPLTVRRVWVDYNTLRTPALYYEKVSHVPMDAARVRELRWMYNKGPHELGPYSLIPGPRGENGKRIPAAEDSGVAPPLPSGGQLLPQSPAKSPSGPPPPPLPPLPDKLETPSSTGPVAHRSSRRTRTAQVPGAWRFVQ